MGWFELRDKWVGVTRHSFDFANRCHDCANLLSSHELTRPSAGTRALRLMRMRKMTLEKQLSRFLAIRILESSSAVSISSSKFPRCSSASPRFSEIFKNSSSHLLVESFEFSLMRSATRCWPACIYHVVVKFFSRKRESCYSLRGKKIIRVR